MRHRRRDPEMKVSVNNRRCHRYGICVVEAPEVFWLVEDGQLRYDSRPDMSRQDQVRMAARCCPMQAIAIQERAK